MAAPPSRVQPPQAAKGAGTRTVLAVDDEPGVRAFLREALEEDHEYRVLAAEGAAEALLLLEKEDVQVCLLDIRMPGMDGIDCLRRMRALDDRVEVVMLSANTEIARAVEAMRAGAYDYLEKPCELSRLYLVVSKAAEKAALRRQVGHLRRLTNLKADCPMLIAGGKAMAGLLDAVARAAPTDSTVLLEGESGTGKELVAARIHGESLRAGGPFVPIHCGALPGPLLESELFGHEKGAFTGAAERRTGLQEAAEGGTVFLDEVGEMGPEAQVRLLRFHEGGEVRPVGASRPYRVDVRVIAATNRVLAQDV
ncbi:MAG: sigma-54-dependent Fis family transcriptional regulator [Planctomycetes bacterium]|nr:sigma-54-dependent Fis family transcriptional regulator [Planctomycetota bacterium]